MSEAAVALAPWIAAQRTSLLAQRGHAWLLQGPSGLGQYTLGLELVRAWLCDNAPTLPAARGSLPPEGALAALGRPGGGSVPTQQGACGHCGSCHAIDVRTHADLCVLMPEVQMMALGWPLSEKAQARSVWRPCAMRWNFRSAHRHAAKARPCWSTRPSR